MDLRNCFGEKFLDKSTFDVASEINGLDLRGACFFTSENTDQGLLERLSANPLETLKNISRDLDGAFILIFTDSLKGEIWAVTDPYGLNKLYYLRNGGQVQLTDDMSDFLNQQKLEFSMEGVHEYLRFLDISPPATCYDGVQILDGGTILKISQNGQSAEIFDCSASGSIEPTLSFDEAVTKTRCLLSNALKKRMELSDKVGLFLSGGVDSSLLAGLISELGYAESDGKIVAYTVGFQDERLDESPIAIAVASHLGIEHKVFKFDIEEEFQAFFDVCDLLDVPFADPAVIPTYLSLLRMRADGVTGVMEGTGADGLIGAIMPAFYHRILKIDAVLPSPLRGLISNILKAIGDPKEHLPYFDFEGPEERFIRWKGWSRSEIEKLCGDNCDFSNTAFYKAFQENKKAGAYELYRKLMINMPDYRIIDTCRLMEFDPIFPFFDQGLKTFVESLPMEYKCREGENKALFKALLAEIVPRQIWDVPKHGFNYPFEKLLLYKNADLVNRYLGDDLLKDQNLFDADMVRKYRDMFLGGDCSLKFKIWALVVFNCWLEKNK